MRAAVVALGDLGRSARMQYHAHALAAAGADVDFVGYEGTPLPRSITAEPGHPVHRVSAPPARLRRGAKGSGYLLAAIVDACRTSARLWRHLRGLQKPDLVLV